MVGCIIQARKGSTRLPNKILMELPYGSGITVLQQVIARVKKVNLIDKIIVATTVEEQDSEIVGVSEKENILHYRGSLDNVLERYYYAAKQEKLDVIVRITSDCPCIDFSVMQDAVKQHLDNGNDYTTVVLNRTFPHGLDVEVFNFSVLEDAFLNATEKYETEHVTTYIYKSHPEKFKIQNIKAKNPQHAPHLRVTLDTEMDYILLCSVYDYLYKNDNHFKCEEIINLFNEKPWLNLINRDILQKKVCKDLSEEIEEAVRILRKQDLYKVVDLLEKSEKND